MKFNIPKDWIMKKAQQEEGQSVEAGVLHPEAPTPTREQWLERCAARFRSVCPSMSVEDAKGLAESQLENLNDDLTENPEDAADDEMSYWGD
jgi:hypothetical protein